MSKINVLRDKILEKAKNDLEMSMRAVLAQQLNELMERAVTSAMANTEITIDGETLEINVRFKE